MDPNQFLPERFLMKINSLHGMLICHLVVDVEPVLALLELKTTITRLMQRVIIEDVGKEQNTSGGFMQCVTCFPKHLAVRITIDSNETRCLSKH
jgi:hypothetical protein